MSPRTGTAKRRDSWEWKLAPKLFHDFNEPMDGDSYLVVLPKHITIGDSELEIDGVIEGVDKENERCFVFRVRRVGEYRDFENGLWIERRGAPVGHEEGENE